MVLGNIPDDAWGLAANAHNQLEALPTLQVPGHPEVYVVGDLAGLRQDGLPLPMVAQLGIQTGAHAGRNILRQAAGQPPVPFHYRDIGVLTWLGLWGLLGALNGGARLVCLVQRARRAPFAGKPVGLP